MTEFSQAMKTRELIQNATSALAKVGCDSPRLDAELLLMSAWQIERTALIIRAHDPVPENIQQDFGTLLERRKQREPLAYILGQKEFWSRSFQVNADVLIPRPETEHLIEAVLERFPDRQGAYHFCDIGTGSGCIAVTLACEYPNAHIVATDISNAALQIASGNANTHQCSGRITFRVGDMLHALHADDGPFDAIISNPPYVAEHEMEALEKELAHEPRHALTDTSDGLKFLRIILKEGQKHLKDAAYMMLETGPCGLPDTPESLTYKQPIHDLAGHLRGGVYRFQQR